MGTTGLFADHAGTRMSDMEPPFPFLHGNEGDAAPWMCTIGWGMLWRLWGCDVLARAQRAEAKFDDCVNW